jgi:hypothetical protein
MTKRENKNNNKANGDRFVTSPILESYILPNDDFTSIPEPSPIANQVVASDDGCTVTKIFGCLGIKEANALLQSLPLLKKLHLVIEIPDEEKVQIEAFQPQNILDPIQTMNYVGELTSWQLTF